MEEREVSQSVAIIDVGSSSEDLGEEREKTGREERGDREVNEGSKEEERTKGESQAHIYRLLLVSFEGLASHSQPSFEAFCMSVDHVRFDLCHPSIKHKRSNNCKLE